MTVRKTLLAAGTAALVGAPAWALPSQALSHPSGPPSSTPNNLTNPGASHRSSSATDALEDHAQQGKHEENSGSNSSGSQGKSHKCKPHKVAYVASGVLVSQRLEKNTDGTYSGEVTVEVKQTNRHARTVKGTTKTYTKEEVEKVHVTFGLADTNNDGSVGLDDLKAGDRVTLIGKITTLAKKCDHTGFTAKTAIRHIVFNAPSSS
jgi:hypothetical protein